MYAQVAEKIRPLLEQYTQAFPAVLEIPSKDHPYGKSRCDHTQGFGMRSPYAVPFTSAEDAALKPVCGHCSANERPQTRPRTACCDA